VIALVDVDDPHKGSHGRALGDGGCPLKVHSLSRPFGSFQRTVGARGSVSPSRVEADLLEHLVVPKGGPPSSRESSTRVKAVASARVSPVTRWKIPDSKVQARDELAVLPLMHSTSRTPYKLSAYARASSHAGSSSL